MVGRWGLLLLLVGCGAKPPAHTDSPFPEDTDDAPTLPDGTTTFPDDTGFGGPVDQAPEHWLHVRHLGSWTLSGSPVSAASGFLTVEEIVDELEDSGDLPDCRVVYAMTAGPPAEPQPCPGCAFALDVTFTVTEGDLELCRWPELPRNGDVWQMAYATAEQALLREYNGTGVWVSWYDVEPSQPDNLTFGFSTSLGLTLEETD